MYDKREEHRPLPENIFCKGNEIFHNDNVAAIHP